MKAISSNLRSELQDKSQSHESLTRNAAAQLQRTLEVTSGRHDHLAMSNAVPHCERHSSVRTPLLDQQSEQLIV